MLIWTLFIGITLAGLVQWYFDRRWKRNLDDKYDTILHKLAHFDFSAEKQLVYIEVVKSDDQSIEKKFYVNTVEQLLSLTTKKPIPNNWSVSYDDEVYGTGWGDLESEK